MFDKYWYRQREFQYIDGIQEEQNFQFSNQGLEERKEEDDKFENVSGPIKNEHNASMIPAQDGP